MKPYLKHFLKNAAVGATTGALFGAACGSGAGVSGLHQMCSGTMNNSPCVNQIKPLIMDESASAAASAGAAAGAAIGAVTCAIIYPIYEGIVGWCYPRIKQNSIIAEGSSVNVEVSVDASPKERVTA